MKLRNPVLMIIIIMVVVSGWGNPEALAEDRPSLLPPDCPDCCKKPNLYPGIDVDSLMRIKYIVKYTKIARDYKGVGRFFLVDKRGFKRTRKWHRFRIILEKEGIDYKDLVVVTEPQHVKGLAVLTWQYLDPDRERDNWIWLPSQRKLRRVSPAESDDSALGSDWTTEEMSTRRWEDETYRFIDENGKFEGYSCRYDGKTYYEDVEGWVVEATPKRDPWYYSKRILFIPRNLGVQIHDDIYDPKGRKFKEFLKVYEKRENGCIENLLNEIIDRRTDHMTVINFEKNEYNVDLDKKLLSPKALMRIKW